MRRWCPLAVSALLATLAGACDQPVPPPVAVREPSLDAEDLAVMRAVLDHARGGRQGAGRLVVETTIAVCEGAIEAVAPPPGGCLGSRALDSVSRVLPSESRVTALLAYQARNARRLPISGGLGDGVTHVSATLLDFGSTSDIVTLSAPSYPGPRVAVVAYRLQGQEAAVRLERRAEGWAVTERRGAVE